MTAFSDWLAAINPRTNTTNGDRLAYLYFCNGASMVVSQWGIFSNHPNGHPLGLEQADAIELIAVEAFCRGCSLYDSTVGDQVMEYLNRYYDRVIEKKSGGAIDADS